MFFFSTNNDEIMVDSFGELIIDKYEIVYMFENDKAKINPIIDSMILNSQQTIELIKTCEFSFKSEFKLLYRATRDGFSSKVFPSKCDKISKTLTIIKVKDAPHIFGGYAEVTWGGNGYKQDKIAFLFSLVNDYNKPLKLKNINQFSQHLEDKEIYSHSNCGPTFGGGHDFFISSDSNINEDSFSNLGHTYKYPILSDESYDPKSILAGSNHFSTSEIEVYEIINNIIQK